ncbi:MAG TPA: HDOD domain-containing protein [Anaeromyxobacter sp.]
MIGEGGQGAAQFGSEADLDRAIEDLIVRDALTLPPYPGISLRIADLVRERDYGLDSLARLVRSDAALALDLLRAANSAYYGLGRVVSLEQAVVRVGVEHLERLALATELDAHALARGPLFPLRRLAWHDALASAVLSRELAKARSLPPEEAFTCGLLHDFGRIVAIGAIERIAAGSRTMPAHFWESVVDRHHVRLGSILAERWDLPAPVAEAIRLHHGGGAEVSASPQLVQVVRIVDAAVRLLGERAGVTAADLAVLALLTERETAALVRILRVLPTFVASLDGAPEPRGPGLLDGDAAAPRPTRGHGLRVRIGGHEWVALGVGPHQLAIRGGFPLPEGSMIEVEVLEGRGFAFHARVLLAWPDRSAFGAVLMPFGLSGPALLDWQGLVPASATA